MNKSQTTSISPAFERTYKRRQGYPSETSVIRGLRFVRVNKRIGGEAWSQGVMSLRFRIPVSSNEVGYAASPVSERR